MSEFLPVSKEMMIPAMEEPRYQTVIFDVGGTLVGFEDDGPFEKFLTMVQRPHRFVSGADLRLSMLRILSTRRDEATGLGVDNDALNKWWLTIFEVLFPESPIVARYMWELFKRNYFDSLFPDTLPTLQRLKARGVPMGIISNYGPNLLGLLLKFNIANYFDFAIISANEGVAKPDPKIFELGLEAAGVLAHQALYVGDNVIDDIEGANNVGLDAVLINRPGRKPSTAPLMIDNLLEIESLVFPQMVTSTPTERSSWSQDPSLLIVPSNQPQYSMTA
jgi:HAD superfamily hydrolase (TIGR01549 family)